MRIQIDGPPIPYARPRVTKFATFDPRSSEKKRVKAEMLSKRPEKLEGPLRINLIFNIYIPKSASKKKQLEMEEGVLKPTKKPDLDNLVKFILDCSNGILFHDDSHILEITASKRYSKAPSTILHVETIEQNSQGL